MFKFWKQHSINQINIIAVLFAGIFAAVSAFVIIFNEYREFQKELTATEKIYLQNEKTRAIEQTSTLYRLIEYRNSELENENLDIKKSRISKEVSAVLDDSNSGGYIFIYDSNKNVIYKSKDFMDNRSLVNDMFTSVKNGGTFLIYNTRKNEEFIENLVFIKEFKPLGWIIGSGMNIGEKDIVLAKKREEHRNKITGFILKIITLTLFLYLASILKYRYITEKLSTEIKFIVQSLKNASKNYRAIDRSKIKFSEFKEITTHANTMLFKLKEKKSALEDMNLNLENLVEKKTRELQESAEYASELLAYQDKFLKNAIHEINTPLSIILMNIDLYNLKFDRNQYLIKIEAAVKVLENIYGDLSFIVKKEREDRRVDMLNFSDFVKDRVNYFTDVALGNKLKIKSEIDNEIFLLFNEFELQRLCDNNISNAIKYSYINKNVYVRLYLDEGCTVFEVENSGEKIIDEKNIFSRYYREDNARGGFGLGLNIVKEICNKNNVYVEVKSDGNTTVFKYFFESSRRVES
jgi:signal transduction histidine kinase